MNTVANRRSDRVSVAVLVLLVAALPLILRWRAQSTSMAVSTAERKHAPLLVRAARYWDSRKAKDLGAADAF